MFMKLRPLQDWAVIARIDSGDRTATGIIIPDTAKEKPSEGVVKAIGPGKYKTMKGKEKKKKFMPTIVRPGQRVVYTEYMAREIDLDGEQIILVREEDILGIFEDEKQLAPRKTFPVEAKHERPPMLKKKEELKKPAKKTAAKKSKAHSKMAGTAAGAKAKTGKKGAPKPTTRKKQTAKSRKRSGR
jgi:chaperonin GroES